jgi:hypothetical protein
MIVIVHPLLTQQIFEPIELWSKMEVLPDGLDNRLLGLAVDWQTKLVDGNPKIPGVERVGFVFSKIIIFELLG